MVPAPFRVLLDANALFPFTLRDTLLRAAAAGYFQVYWSEQILDEARRNLVAKAIVTEEQATRLFDAMARAFPEERELAKIDEKLFFDVVAPQPTARAARRK